MERDRSSVDQQTLFENANYYYIDDIENYLREFPEAEKKYKKWEFYSRFLFSGALLSLLGAASQAITAESNKIHGYEYVSHEQNGWAGVAIALGLTAASLIADSKAINQARPTQLSLKLDGSRGKFTKID